MKAVVLAAGLGTRLRRADARAPLEAVQAAAADRGLKALVPVGGRPFLDYGLSRLADAGVREVCLVVGPSSAAIREHYAAAPPGRLRVVFAEQPEPRGTADALLPAEAFVAGEDFLALNSDNLYPVSALTALERLGEPGLPVFERAALLASSNFTAERVARFASLAVGPDGYLERVVEKPGPEEPAPSGEVLLSMNLWRFSPAIFDACRRVALSTRGEYELPQAVAFGVAARGLRFRTFRCAEGVLDLSAREDVAALDARLAGVEARP